MSTQDASVIEKTSEGFSKGKVLENRDKAKLAVKRIAEQIEVGMLEEDANLIVVNTLKEMGAQQAFHKPYIRFGSNTIKTFGAASEHGVRLGTDDIFFIDVGPVWDGYEGDAGDTFVTGNNPELKRCADDARLICESVAKMWKDNHSNGIELYEHAQKMAKEKGWVLNLDLGGHRLGEFPSSKQYEGPLSEIPFHPSSYLWMVEIQIHHPEQEFGAFYEDMLI